MDTIFINAENSKTTEPKKIFSQVITKIGLKKLEEIVCSTKLFYRLHLDKYKTTIQ